jgi:CDP-diacylglycerol--glycerol-3-phosphate 3-phosphatidyltransferase
LIKEESKEEPKETFTAMLRRVLSQPINWMGSTLHGWGVTANLITAIGLIGTVIGAFLASRGKLLAGGVVMGAMGALDALDGAVARASGKVKPFGAFIDSVSDRYSELAIYAALSWFFSSGGNALGAILSMLAFGGSVLVSYTRARAEGLGIETKVGILTRVERMIVIVPALILGYPLIGVGIVALLANVTALQRMADVWMKTRDQEDGEES